MYSVALKRGKVCSQKDILLRQTDIIVIIKVKDNILYIFIGVRTNGTSEAGKVQLHESSENICNLREKGLLFLKIFNKDNNEKHLNLKT